MKYPAADAGAPNVADAPKSANSSHLGVIFILWFRWFGCGRQLPQPLVKRSFVVIAL